MEQEGLITEFKESWRDDWLKTICAFANSRGGILKVGINDNVNIVGVKNARKLLEDIPNKCLNRLHINVQVRGVNVDSKDTVEIEVKPTFTPVSFNGKYYIRSGSTSQELKGAELNQFLIEKSNKNWESFVESRATFNEIDLVTIEKYKELAGKSRQPLVLSERDPKIILEKLGLLEENKPVRAALLLFGKTPQKFYPSAHLKIGEFDDVGRLISSSIFEGNLFDQLEKGYDFLRAKFIGDVKFEGLVRLENKQYPDEALREALVNALIHKDYTGSHLQIKLFPHKFQVWNPGSLPIGLTVKKLREEHPSKPRNPLLAKVFYNTGFIETWGSGTIKIINGCKEASLPEPLFVSDDNGFLLTIVGDPFNKQDLIKRGLSNRQIEAVEYLKENRGIITNQLYRELFNVSRATATNDLARLNQLEIVKQTGTGAGAGSEYELNLN